MPPVQAPAKVLVTGANGYIGLWVVRILLRRGFAVRGAVRTGDKGDALVELLRRKEGDRAHDFEYVVVGDIDKEGAFDDAVKGVDAVIHTASPVKLDPERPSDVIEPAVKGTQGILDSILKHGPTVRRVVITSSTAAVASWPEKPTVFDESAWNDVALEMLQSKGDSASGLVVYCSSKVLAERAAWNLFAEHKHELKADLTVICPTMVFGPLPDDPPTPAGMTHSMTVLWSGIFGPNQQPESYITSGNNFVDVRDVAEMHVRAIELEDAGGARIIANSQPYVMQDWLDAAHELTPPVPNVPCGIPGAGSSVRHVRILANEKAKRLLGIRFKTIQETCTDTFEDFRKRGWLADL